MDILMVIDKKDKKKFIKKAEEIKNVFEKQNLEVKEIVSDGILKINKIKLCLLFSNDSEYVKYICTNTKVDAICITSRLETSYILEILEKVKDIHFLNTSTEEICARILSYIKLIENRRKCMNDEFYFAEN